MIKEEEFSIFLMYVKRGLFWSRRNIEIDDDNELRFECPLLDIEISQEDDKIIKLISKSKYIKLIFRNFKEIKITHDGVNEVLSFRDCLKEYIQRANDPQIVVNEKEYLDNSSFNKICESESILKDEDEDEKIDDKLEENRNSEEIKERALCEDIEFRYQDMINVLRTTRFQIFKHISHKNVLIEYSGKNNNIFKLLEVSTIKNFKNSATFLFISCLSFIILKIFMTNSYLYIIFFIVVFASTLYVINQNFTKDLYTNIPIEESENFFRISKIYNNTEQEILEAIKNVKAYPVWISFINDVIPIKENTYNINFELMSFSIFNEKELSLNKAIKIVNLDKSTLLITEKETNNVICILSVSHNDITKQTKLNIYVRLNKETNPELLKDCLNKIINSLGKLEIFIENNKYPDFTFIKPLKSEPSQVQVEKTTELNIDQKLLTEETNVDSIFSKETSLFKYSNGQSEQYYKVISDLHGQIPIYEMKGWKLMEEKSEYKSFYFDEISGFRSTKVEALIHTNTKNIFDYMVDLSLRTNYDKNFDHGHNLSIIDDDLKIHYLKFKGKLFVSPRDFVVLQFSNFVILLFNKRKMMEIAYCYVKVLF